jgi:hypothetical protein
MNYQNFKDFFSLHSLPSVVIAIIVALLTFIINQVLVRKISRSLKIYAPFLLGIILYFIYDLIFVKSKPFFNFNTLSLGFTAGALSCVISALIKRIFKKNGEKVIDLSPIGLLVESIIYPLIKEPDLKLAVIAIEKLLGFVDNLNDEKVVTDITDILSDHTDDSVSMDELNEIAKLIVISKKNLSAN